jgi:hypothetical protein
VIAKRDRPWCNAAFLLTLRDSGLRFAAVDLPEANDLTVGIMALVARQERGTISRRTEALAAAGGRDRQRTPVPLHVVPSEPFRIRCGRWVDEAVPDLFQDNWPSGAARRQREPRRARRGLLVDPRSRLYIGSRGRAGWNGSRVLGWHASDSSHRRGPR